MVLSFLWFPGIGWALGGEVGYPETYDHHGTVNHVSVRPWSPSSKPPSLKLTQKHPENRGKAWKFGDEPNLQTSNTPPQKKNNAMFLQPYNW